MPQRRSPTQIATEALQQIARHERECGERWKECNETLKDLKQRWEKLAWIICGSVLTGAAAVVVKEFLT